MFLGLSKVFPQSPIEVSQKAMEDAIMICRPPEGSPAATVSFGILQEQFHQHWCIDLHFNTAVHFVYGYASPICSYL